MIYFHKFRKFRPEFRHCANHRHCERSEAISLKIPEIPSRIPSLRGVSEANDEAISFKILRLNKRDCFGFFKASQ